MNKSIKNYPPVPQKFLGQTLNFPLSPISPAAISVLYGISTDLTSFQTNLMSAASTDAPYRVGLRYVKLTFSISCRRGANFLSPTNNGRLAENPGVWENLRPWKIPLLFLNFSAQRKENPSTIKGAQESFDPDSGFYYSLCLYFYNLSQRERGLLLHYCSLLCVSLSLSLLEMASLEKEMPLSLFLDDAHLVAPTLRSLSLHFLSIDRTHAPFFSLRHKRLVNF